MRRKKQNSYHALRFDTFKFFNSQHLEKGLFVKWFRNPLTQFVEEIFFKSDFCQMNMFSFGGPVDVPWRNLGDGHESNPAVTEICETDGVPSRFMKRFFIVDQCTDVASGCRHHRFNHKACFGDAGGDRCRLNRRDGHTDTHGKDIGVFGVLLVWVDEHKPAWIHQAFDSIHSVNALERRQHHGIFKEKFMFFLFITGVVQFRNVNLVFFYAAGRSP